MTDGMVNVVDVVSFGMYWCTPEFSSLVTIFHDINYNEIGCPEVKEWLYGKPRTNKTAIEEFESLRSHLSTTHVYDLQIESGMIVKDIMLSFVVWMSCDLSIDFKYLSRTFMMSLDIGTLKRLIDYHPTSSLLCVYATDTHFSIILFEYTSQSTKIRCISSELLVISSILRTT
jgi:hypothetical protein